MVNRADDELDSRTDRCFRGPILGDESAVIARAFSPQRQVGTHTWGFLPQAKYRTGRWPFPDNGKNNSNNGRYDLYVDASWHWASPSAETVFPPPGARDPNGMIR